MTAREPHRPAPSNSHFRLWFWLVAALMFFGFISLIRSILLPFVVGMLAAYFLDPAVRRLRKLGGWSRGTSAAVITVGFFAFAIGLCILVVPLAARQMAALLQDFPGYVEYLQNRYSQEIAHYLSLLSPDQVNTIKGSLGSSGTTLMGWGAQVAGGALRSGLALLNILSLIFITPIVAFYLLRDWHLVVAHFYALLPRDQAETIRAQLHEINVTLSGFIRGQTNVCLIMASYYGVTLSFVGLNFGLLIGLMTGLLLFIPLVGFASCLSLSVIVALFQFQDNTHLFMVLTVYGVGLLIESSFLTPRLVGGKVGLHPLWIIFGMLAGAALFGFVGILISVPVTAVMGVLVRFAIARYLHSSLYIGVRHVAAHIQPPGNNLMGQLSFKWPVRPSYAQEDFIVSEANAAAARALETWPDGRSCAMLLSGPQASGKTHLATSWARRTQAIFIDKNALGNTGSQDLWGTATHAVLEDIDGISRQTALFHLLRHAEVHGTFLLLTARAPAVHLHFALADLRSRLLALPQAAIETPDEDLLKGFLYKCFADRQLQVSEEVIDYLLKRMERSFASAYAMVETLEDRALARAADITVPFVKSILE